MNNWQTETCPCCISVNYIFHDSPIGQAYECWNCGSRHWLDDQARLEYMVYEDVSLEQADSALEDGSVRFLSAYPTQELEV